jgi:hypothetical protein
MHLYLSTNSPWNATYSNTEGQIIYKAESPRLLFGIGPLPITVERALSSNVAKTEKIEKAEETDNVAALPGPNVDYTEKKDNHDAAALPGPFCPLAEIDFHSSSFTASRIRYNSIDMTTSEFFRKAGFFRK